MSSCSSSSWVKEEGAGEAGLKDAGEEKLREDGLMKDVEAIDNDNMWVNVVGVGDDLTRSSQSGGQNWRNKKAQGLEWCVCCCGPNILPTKDR
jgi:hypothetical protein